MTLATTAPVLSTAELSLEELLERARQEPTSFERLKWCDPLVDCGLPAIEGIKSWLVDPALGFFATIVIRRVGERLGAQAAVSALCEGRRTAPPSVRINIATALERLGGACGEPPADDRYARSYTRPDEIYHLVVDVVDGQSSWGEILLTKCGWAYTRETIESLGGPVDPLPMKKCGHCRRAQEGPSD